VLLLLLWRQDGADLAVDPLGQCPLLRRTALEESATLLLVGGEHLPYSIALLRGEIEIATHRFQPKLHASATGWAVHAIGETTKHVSSHAESAGNTA
jgi:hypothetical protein